jgi:dethiobiotin synthetase
VRARGLFVAGTDTGVGKTTVAVALVRLALRAGRVPIPYKPVETGCAPDPRDARRLWEAARPPITLADVCPYPLPLPAAPAAAAAAAGLRLNVAQLVERGVALATRGDFFLVEGAGGLLAPYDGRATNADLAAGLGLPVLVVGRTALGTINHVALTLAELGRRGLPVAGVILVHGEGAISPHEATNDALIEGVTGTRPLGTVHHLVDPDLSDPDRLADALTLALAPATLRRLLGQPE